MSTKNLKSEQAIPFSERNDFLSRQCVVGDDDGIVEGVILGITLE